MIPSGQKAMHVWRIKDRDLGDVPKSVAHACIGWNAATIEEDILDVMDYSSN